MFTTPPQPKNSFRIILNLTSKQRLDGLLLAALREQSRNPELKNISRSAFKNLFKEKRIQMKGQNAVPSSMLAIGTSFVDILGFVDTTANKDDAKQE